MQGITQQKLTLFAANARFIQKEFLWQGALVKKLAALLYAFDGKPIDCAAIKRSHALIKDSTGAFSTFRGNMALGVAAMLSLKSDPSELLTNAIAVYEMLKSAKFRASDYLVVAAYEIASQAKPEEYGQAVARARAFYDGMKAKGFFRTRENDAIFAAMLGLSDLDVETGTQSVEQLYRRFKPEFWPGNSVQALAQVLVLGGECETAIDRILAIRDAMKYQKIRLDKAYTLPSLGILALLPVDIDALVQALDEARAFLKKQKGFGPLSVSKQALLLFASAIVASAYAEDIKNGVIAASVSTSIASIIIAQQAAMIAAMSASAGAAAGAAAASSG
ncbi:MAG: DUF4003 domain-containing protein [Clostridia bacterium]|nr:DUF4003 domain-containing protein [Clostridia bacterium]